MCQDRNSVDWEANIGAVMGTGSLDSGLNSVL